MGTATLGHLIERLAKEDPNKVIPLGFSNPHSYRGYYEDLAFEPAQDARVGDMLTAAMKSVGQTFHGYKGGEYTMDEYTTVWLAEYGSTGETIGPHFLELMLANTK